MMPCNQKRSEKGRSEFSKLESAERERVVLLAKLSLRVTQVLSLRLFEQHSQRAQNCGAGKRSKQLKIVGFETFFMSGLFCMEFEFEQEEETRDEEGFI